MPIKLFPHILIRVGGGPFEKLQRLDLIESMEIVDEIMQQKTSLEKFKQKLCDDLFIIIQSQNENPALQKQILNLKRDIFNERNISQGKYNFFDTVFSEGLKNQLKEYEEQKARIGLLKAHGEQVFGGELRSVRKQLCSLAANENLQKGLLLSSQSLLQSIEEYLKNDGQTLTKKEYKTEEGLIKYISRMYAKTSPFSTFTNLVMGRLSNSLDNHSNLIQFEKNDEPKVVSHIRLNNFLYQYLRGLLIKNPDVYHNFLLRPNPTIQKHDDHFRFLTNSNNIEAFQRIPTNPVVEVFLVLCSNRKEGIRYSDLVSTIIENEYIDASKEDIETFIHQLIEYGFLEYNIGVSGIDPDWDKKLCEQLKPVAKELLIIQDLVSVLVQIREMAMQYAHVELPERKSFLMEAHAQFRSICMKLHEAAGLPEEERLSPEEYQKYQIQKQIEQEKNKKQAEKDGPTVGAEKEFSHEPEEKKDEVFKHHASTFFYFRPEQMFYEDTTLDITPELDSDELSVCISSLYRLLDQMRLFEGRSDECDSMAYYFEQRYGADAKIDLLTFYEDYFREFKKPEAERLNKIRKEKFNKIKKEEEEQKWPPTESPELKIDTPDENTNENKIPKIRERQSLRKQWQESFASLVEAETNLVHPDTFHLMLQSVQENNKATNFKFNNEHDIGSFGAFIQFFEEKDSDGNRKIMGVLNASFPGFGKMISRFLHIFDLKSTCDIRQQNVDISQQDIFVEDCDASYFNANLHPPLMPYEIWMPNGHNSLPPEKQIPVTDLDVSHNLTTGQLTLTHKPTGKTAYIFDMGFQGHGGRSQLFQLLEKFTLAEYLSVYPINMAINSLYEPKDKDSERTELRKHVSIRPRIVYDNWLVLQRKAWIIPKELLPHIQPKETDWSYFERINEWRYAYQIPDEVFMFVIGRGNENIKPEEGKKLGRDDRKPQYISFKNPFLVSLFASLINKVPSALRIEEMLPSSRQLNRLGKDKYVTEFVVQWYTSSREL